MTAMYTYRGANEISSQSQIENLKSQMDRTAWQYDLATGLLTNKVYADGQGPAYAYDPAGRLTRRTWARGVTTDYSYDLLGQLTNIDYSDSTPDVSFTYDRLGRQVVVAHPLTTYLFDYSANTLQLVSEAIINHQSSITNILSRSHDTLGRPSGIGLGSNYAVTYGYDTLGRFASVNWQSAFGNRQFDYSYLPDSDLLSGWSNSCGFAVARVFESNRDLLASVENRFGTNVISRFDYLNDAVGRRTQRIDSASATNDFVYSSRSELIEALMGTNSFSYRYDPIGNRTAATNNGEALRYAANMLNQYTNISDGVTNVPAYDADGNMTAYGGWTFAWDAENRLIVASNAETVVENTYDYMSRRARKKVFTRESDLWPLTSDLSFLYDGWNLISEVRDQMSEVSTNHYVWGLDLSGILQGAGGIGGLLCSIGHEPSAISHFLYDANGNVTELVDTNGAIVAHYEYDPYGNEISRQGAEAQSNPFRFSTKYTDDDTGLVYYGFRYYSPELGRFLSRDPIGELGGLNLNAFIQNRAGNEVDPLGLNALAAFRTAVAAAFAAIASLADDMMAQCDGPCVPATDCMSCCDTAFNIGLASGTVAAGLLYAEAAILAGLHPWYASAILAATSIGHNEFCEDLNAAHQSCSNGCLDNPN